MALLRFALVCLLLTPAIHAETISVSVAISLQDAMKEIAAAYEAGSEDDVQFTFGSSGQLMAQIRNGAPVDAFISAANKQVDELVEAGRLDKATRRVVAGNRLVLIVPKDAKAPPGSFADLADAKHARVAIGEPKTVPAGQYAMQVLEKLDVAKSLKGRLLYGANVRQVLDYVIRSEVAAGLVYATDAKQAGEKVLVVATADADTHDPIVYPAAVVTASPRRAAAGRFLDYLGGKEAGKILAARGFSTPKDEDSADRESTEKAGEPEKADGGQPPANKSAKSPSQREPAAR